jgi:plasmid stabilization system protein ParE
MKAQQILNRAAHAASKHKDDLSRMAFHIGALEAEVTMLCHAINEYTPVAEGVETTFKHAGCDLVVFYEADSDGDIDITGVFANGMDITDMLMDTPVMDLVMEHVTDHAYIQRKQAEYDRAEQQWENRRDADMEGGAV